MLSTSELEAVLQFSSSTVLIGGYTLYLMEGHFMCAGNDFPHFGQEVSFLNWSKFWKWLIYRSQAFLNNLHRFIAKLSQWIHVKACTSSGGGSMRGRQEDTEFFYKTFPVFIWLFRDVTLSIPPDYKDVNEFVMSRVCCNFK